MVSWHTLLFILWVNIIRGDSSLNFNEGEDNDESSKVNKEEPPAYPKPFLDDDAANTGTNNKLDGDLIFSICDGGGYAVYENGVYIDGTASCDEAGTYCCMMGDDNIEREEAAVVQQQSSRNSLNENIINSTENCTEWMQNITNCSENSTDCTQNITNITSTNCAQNNINLKAYFHPCDGFTGVVCHGTLDSPNCEGEEACRNSTIGVVKDGSCRGTKACKDTNIKSVSTKSCIGEDSCSEANIGIVAESSCRGSTACHKSNIGSVTFDSCVADREACAGGTIDRVSQGSCQQFKSCSASFLGIVLGASCRGHYACGAQYHEKTRTVLDYVSQSCIGPHACHRSTIREAILGSCVGNFPCGNFYGYTSNLVSVHNRSCVGNYVCMDATIENVKDMSCTGRDSCRQSTIGNLSEKSCFGDLSCQGAKIKSARQSCLGNRTCQKLFINGSLSNSCQDPWMCISGDHTGDLEDLCRGPLETAFPPPCSRGTSYMQSYGTAFVTMALLAAKFMFHAG